MYIYIREECLCVSVCECTCACSCVYVRALILKNMPSMYCNIYFI